ncbi:MAG: threonine/serine dehydratase [Candidatus Heimdallarchaeum aukensis]|uniref:Threonine/serine dehydratase n=1 Tax=Candidatus Heimdallarchaeum aukensis TaxID=2876573 RepID=A0A9Y1BI02_9ARCH|nr:MAG: threonine/serine dehydratase [Candidatus Heimdallarchaeum aukensis]
MCCKIKEVHAKIRQYINKTPVMTSTTLNKLTKAECYLKCENFQKMGAFKIRGAVNAILNLTEEQKKKGVITHSSGNHAQALSLAASFFNVKATIVMPENAPKVKIEATRNYGGEVIFCGNKPLDREKKTEELIKQHDYTLIHPSNNWDIIRGAGTAAYELIHEIQDLDYVFAPVGGGGLLSGTSLAVKELSPKTKVIGVEPEKADDAFRSIRDNKIYPSINPDTIADGLRTSLGNITFSVIRDNVDKIILVTEEEIVKAMEFLWSRMKLVVEPSGAVSLAGLLKQKESIKNKRVGAIISGGNIDLTDFFAKFKGL